MDAFKKGWFSELNEMWPGQSMSLQVEEVLHHEKSQYQDILVFKSKTYGHVLVLDGVVQCTERDEFAYQEMIAHIPLCSHPDPRSVLVVGGGDGGVLREVEKHKSVEEIHICEIDEQVIEVSKRYLPQMAIGYSSPKVKVHIQDGMEFMAQCQGQFDVIITDSSDPIGPAKCLFEEPYFGKMRAALRPGGIICSQGECQWLDLPLIKTVLTGCRSLFPVVRYAFTTIPTYPSGQIGFVLASLNGYANTEEEGLGDLVTCDNDTVFEDPLRKLSEDEEEEMGLKYYDSAVHKAAFTLPRFARKELEFCK